MKDVHRRRLFTNQRGALLCGSFLHVLPTSPPPSPYIGLKRGGVGTDCFTLPHWRATYAVLAEYGIGSLHRPTKLYNLFWGGGGRWRRKRCRCRRIECSRASFIISVTDNVQHHRPLYNSAPCRPPTHPPASLDLGRQMTGTVYDQRAVLGVAPSIDLG